MNNITIESLPTFAYWTQQNPDKDDNMISAYIDDLKDILPDVMVMASDKQPWCDDKPSREYNTLIEIGRVFGLLIRDLTAIRDEVEAQRATA